MSDPTSAQMPNAIDAAPARPDTGRPAADPGERESGGTSVARHPFVLADVRDPGSDEEHCEEHAPEQDDDPFGRGHDPSLANSPTVALVEAQDVHDVHGRRGPTEADPLLPDGQLVDRTS
jgi:hypothetical protein